MIMGLLVRLLASTVRFNINILYKNHYKLEAFGSLGLPIHEGCVVETH